MTDARTMLLKYILLGDLTYPIDLEHEKTYLALTFLTVSIPIFKKNGQALECSPSVTLGLLIGGTARNLP
ncbi:MAG: hypothetical protein OEZ02_05910 [Anaerolineae bacterium]|nr:hypothetical protein [Anaerolineae bacterium]